MTWKVVLILICCIILLLREVQCGDVVTALGDVVQPVVISNNTVITDTAVRNNFFLNIYLLVLVLAGNSFLY